MSSNQLPPQGESIPISVQDVPSKHNITLGHEQTQRKNVSSPSPVQSFSQNYAIQFELKNISRQVGRIATKADKSKLPIGQSAFLGHSFPNFQEHNQLNLLEKDLSSMLNIKTNPSTLSKYNYYGRQYRFVSQNPSQTSQKPLDSNHPHQNQELSSVNPNIKQNYKRQELDMPDSKSYYIYFDNPKKQKQITFKIPKIQQNNNGFQSNRSSPMKKQQALYGSLNVPKNTNFSLEEQYDDQARTPPLKVFSKQQPDSKWVLEKKVKRLQKQLHMMKKKEEQRQKIRNFVSSNSKKDSKVFVGRQVDQLINSLWP